jgi:hypothetical protein
MDNHTQHRSHARGGGIRALVAAVAVAVLLLALAPSAGLAEQPKRLPHPTDIPIPDHHSGAPGHAQSSLLVSAAPAAPVLVAPADGNRTCDNTPLCQWLDVGGATVYQIQVDNNASFASPEVDEWVSATSLELDSMAAGEYYWRVRASNASGDGPWSGVWRFVVEPLLPLAPTLTSPANASQTCEGMPTFQWAALANASSYRIQIDNNPSFTSPEDDATTSATHYSPASSLMPGTWYWRVRGSNYCGNSPWSAIWWVTIGLEPDPPALFTPMDGIVICDTTPDFEWDVAIGAISYRIQVDNDAAFASPEINATTTQLHYTAPSPLPVGVYFWRVRTAASCGEGPWSAAWSFGIEGMPGAPSSPLPANGASGVSVDADLDWADCAGASTYDVYFGTTAAPSFLATVSVSAYDLPTLSSSTDYYWKIAAKSTGCQTHGPVWHFRTAAGGANRPPTNGTITPNSGGTPAGNTVYFTTTWSDPDGEADLKACRLHIGRWAAPKSLIGNAVVLYQARTNKLLIRNDRGTRWWGGKPLGSNNVIQNSQVKVHCKLTTVGRTVNTITVRWALEFKPAFRGKTKMYLKARDLGGLTSPLEKKGTWTVQ